MTWLFEKRNIIITGYSGVWPLISLNVFIYYWVYRRLRCNGVTSQLSQIARSQGRWVARPLVPWCDMRRCDDATMWYAISHIGVRRFLKCDAMDLASLLCGLLMSMGKHFTLFLRCDMALREFKHENLLKAKIFEFFLRVPLCLILLLIPSKEGGCWWPQQATRFNSHLNFPW